MLKNGFVKQFLDLYNRLFEFKQGEDIERLAREAMEQIHEKQYYAGLSGETILLGIAHNLKHCEIVSEVR